MPRYVAFLRGMNLGNRRLKMEALRAHFEQLGFRDVKTFIASGNVIFSSKSTDAARLEHQIEGHLAKTLGYPVATFVRTADEVLAVALAEPFAQAGREPPATSIHTGFFKKPLKPDTARTLSAFSTETDAFRTDGREVHWLCRIPVHESRVWSSPAVRALKLPTVTLRNRKMLLRLAEVLQAKKG